MDGTEAHANGSPFGATILQGSKTATGVVVPDDIVAALGAGKRPPVRVTIRGYTTGARSP